MNQQLSFFEAFPTAKTLQAHPYTAAQLDALLAQGEAYCQQGLPALSYADFMLYWQTGDREHYQRRYFDRRGHLLVFSLLAKLYPQQPRWMQLLEEAVWAICSEALWCLPAHFIVTDGVPLPFEAYETCLDLFACETAFALAETAALHRNTLPPLLLTLIEQQVQRRVFTPFSQETLPQRFETMRNNWSGVCASAIGGAALHLLEDTPQRTTLLERCKRALEVYLGSFGEDGICTEGVDYWSYGFGFFVCFADLLFRATQGKTDLLATPRAQAIAASQLAFYLGGTCTLSFSDGSADSRFRAGLSCYLQQRVPAARLPALECAAPLLKDTCFRYCLGVRDFLWFEGTLPFGAAAQSTWYPHAQWFLSRKGYSTLAAKAGHNGESHNHNDCGSFVLCQNGRPLLCDLGAGLYDAAYFGPQRYEIFVNRTESHNAPLPAGQEQCAGAAYAAQVLSCNFCAQQDEFSVDLTACYPAGSVQQLTRTFLHHADGTLHVTDCAAFAHPDTLAVHFVSQTPISFENGVARFGIASAGVLLKIPQGFAATTACRSYDGHDCKPQTAYVLRVHNITPSGQVTAPFVFTPVL